MIKRPKTIRIEEAARDAAKFPGMGNPCRRSSKTSVSLSWDAFLRYELLGHREAKFVGSAAAETTAVVDCGSWVPDTSLDLTAVFQRMPARVELHSPCSLNHD